ncbi:uridine diphosphate glucose pyrophosphatase NUDT22-like [Homarus americanus]|uniref:uridine diphosphate glucose pyrophosphatase NUDT22-like n=1 Tax=Homarus americanus TaxID=6706 RepID=UPI001C48339A|nr:uridine diphosphate glucose pyrophosphatase NUDT22-like [Homarus americanus]
MNVVEQVQRDNIDLLTPLTAAVAGAAISYTQVGAKFNHSNYARQTCVDIEQQINQQWETRCAKNSRLYNAQKFRFAGWEITGGKWILNIGLTCYKDLSGTNLAPNFRLIQEKGAKDFGDLQAYMSDTLGVGVLLMTKDGHLVVTRRAGWTGEYPGALDRPGGHPEPGRVFTSGGSLKPEDDNWEVDDAVLDEVWSSAAQEVEDELGVARSQMSDLTLMGMDLNREAGGRPSLEFFTKLELSSSEMTEVYSRGCQAEVDETIAIHLLPPPTLIHLHHLLHPPPSPEVQVSPESASRSEGVRGEKSEVREEEITMIVSESLVRDEESEIRQGVTEMQVGENERKHLQEARWVVREATPALRGALLLGFHHCLLPKSPRAKCVCM